MRHRELRHIRMGATKLSLLETVIDLMHHLCDHLLIRLDIE